MKFPNLHIVWTAGKNLALPDTLNRNTPPELWTRKTTVEIPQNIKFFLAKDETSPRLQCKYAVKTDVDQSQINNLQHFSLYLDCQNNHYIIDLLGNSIFKAIPYFSWIKNNTQQTPVKQRLYKKDLQLAQSSVLELILSLFTARVITFEPLVAQLPFFSCSWPSTISNFAKIKSELCEHSFKLKQAF